MSIQPVSSCSQSEPSTTHGVPTRISDCLCTLIGVASVFGFWRLSTLS